MKIRTISGVLTETGAETSAGNNDVKIAYIRILSEDNETIVLHGVFTSSWISGILVNDKKLSIAYGLYEVEREISNVIFGAKNSEEERYLVERQSEYFSLALVIVMSALCVILVLHQSNLKPFAWGLFGFLIAGAGFCIYDPLVGNARKFNKMLWKAKAFLSSN